MKKLLLSLIALAAITRANAVNFTENFTINPLTNGWQIFGDTNLFIWDATHHQVAVKWDSSQPNSYFYHPLGVMLTTNTDFGLDFDLKLNDAAIDGGTFQLAVGLLNLTNATNPGFLRGTGFNATNVVEFDYFMDPFYGNSLAVSEVDTNGYFADVYDNLSLETNTTYHVSITHFAGESLISAQILVSNQMYSSMLGAYLETGFGNFMVDTLVIPSYSDTGAYGASLLAHGTVANISFTTSPNPIRRMTGRFVGPVWQTQFQSYSNWLYTLERSTNFQSWTPAAENTNGNGTVITLLDTNAPPANAYYRIHAER